MIASLLLSLADEDSLKQRDSSIKRNTTLVKKLRAITDEGRESLLKELKTTNTSKARTLSFPEVHRACLTGFSVCPAWRNRHERPEHSSLTWHGAKRFLPQYVSETVAAIVEGKHKVNDIWAAVEARHLWSPALPQPVSSPVPVPPP